MGEAQKNDEIGALGFMYILTFWFLAPYHSGLSKGSSVHSVLAIITQMQPTNLSFQFNFCHFLPTSSLDGFFSCHPFHLFVPCYSVTASLLSWNEDLSLVTLEINSWRVNLHRFLSTLFPPPLNFFSEFSFLKSPMISSHIIARSEVHIHWNGAN